MKKIHKDSEIWQYEGLVEFTDELIEFFEKERKRKEREEKRDFRHIAFEQLDDEVVQITGAKKQVSVERKVEISFEMDLLEEFLNSLTEKQKNRYCLHKLLNMTYEEVAKKEGVSKMTVWESIQQVEKKLKKLK